MKYSLHARHLLKPFCDSAHSVFPATPWSTWRPQFQVRKMKVNILLIVLQLWTEEPEFEHRKCSCKAPALFSVNRVSQSVQSLTCLTLFDPMDCSLPALSVHHQLPELAQTHVHGINDAIQPSHPLSSPSPPAPNPSQHQGFFQRVTSSHQVARVLEFQLQHQSFRWTFRIDFL